MAEAGLLKNGGPKSLDPSLVNVLRNDQLKWVFVGGNGGSGKTTVCCSLALRLAEVRRSVLLLSTDPNKSVSHTFEQCFSKTPTKVSGFDNLSVMEIDLDNENLPEGVFGGVDTINALIQSLDCLPATKMELVLYARIVSLMSKSEFDVIVFDIFLSGRTVVSIDCLPDTLQTTFTAVANMRDRFLPVLSMLGPLQSVVNQSVQESFHRFDEVIAAFRKVKDRLRSAEETTYLAVCTPDFLSVYETEKMIQRLCKRQIDCHNVIVNQSLADGSIENCKLCQPRQKAQAKYIKQIRELYEDFHVVQVPLVEHEIKGSKILKEFSNFMFRE